MERMEQVVPCVLVWLFSIGVGLWTVKKEGRFHGADCLSLQQWMGDTVRSKKAWVLERAKEEPVYRWGLSWWSKFRVEQREREIFEGISYLRNLISVGNGYDINGDYILEELAQLGGAMQLFYIRLLHFLRSNEREKGLHYFVEGVGAPCAAEYGRILTQWDGMKPEALSETLQLYQCSIQERRVTLRKHRDEVWSDLIYLPVVMNVMVLLINFIYIAYFLDQKQMLLTMFQ